MEFEDLGLSEDLLRGIFGYGFERPSEIQREAIPKILGKRDVIAQAHSGTGKTGAFTIASLELVDPLNPRTQVVVLSPTRELTEQTYEVCRGLSRHMKKVNVVLCMGGTPVRRDVEVFSRDPCHVVIATPGRFLQLLQKDVIRLSSLKLLVIDEADEMLKVGFQDQLVRVFRYLTKDAQIAIFSATMPPEAVEISRKFMNDPVFVRVHHEQLTLEGIKQFYINVVHEECKFETLLDLYSKLCVSQAILFCNSKRKVNLLAEQLKAQGFTVGSIHSEMDMPTRNRVYQDFKRTATRILISTDILSRGIDVQGVSFVVNYDLPASRECYLHRIGRSGRYGRKGVAINLVTEGELGDVRALERFYETQIEEMPVNIEQYLD